MSLARSLLAPIAQPSLQQASIPPSDTAGFREPFLAAPTAAGPVITAETALFLTVVLACVQIVVDAITEMPLETYQRIGTGTPTRVDGAWQYELLANEPNPEQDAAQFWGDITGHLCLDWNAFMGKEFGPTGRVKNLWPIRPDWVRIDRKGGVKRFHVRDEFGVETIYTQREIIHARAGYCFDGLRSISPVKFAAQQIGAGIAMERFMNEFWKNGALPTAVLQAPNGFTNEIKARRLASRFQRAYRNRRRGVVVLEDGVEFKPITWSHVDSQFIEQKRELVETIARVWRCPLGKLMTQIGGTSQTYRNQEQERYELYGDAVLPKAIRIESALRRDKDLFPRASGIFPRFDADQVLRADSLTRAKVNQIRTGGAAWSRVDEIRAEDGEGPDPELMAKQLEQPAQTPAVGSGSNVP